MCKYLLIVLLYMSMINGVKSDILPIQVCLEHHQLFPYILGNTARVESSEPGVTVELLQRLDEQMPNINISIVRAPFKRCIQRIEKGISDFMLGSYERSREDTVSYPMKNGLFDPDGHIDELKYCLFKTKKSRLRWEGVQFTGAVSKPVALPRGYSVSILLARYNIPYLEVFSSHVAMEQLIHQQTEASITLCEAGMNIIRQHEEHIEIIQTEIFKTRVYMMFSHQFAHYHPTMPTTLREQVLINEKWAKIRVQQYLNSSYENVRAGLH